MEPVTDEQLKQELAEHTKGEGWTFEYKCAEEGGLYQDSVFICVISRYGRSHKTSFRKGCAHRTWKKSFWRMHALAVPGSEFWEKYYRRGQRVSMVLPQLLPPDQCHDEYTARHQQAVIDAFAAMTEPIPPTFEEVLGSLMSDAQCVYGQTLEEFCEELGFTDAEEAVEAYYGCQAAKTALEAMGVDFN